MPGNMQCQLWMGSLEPNMTESFILSAFNRLGQRPLAVKVMRNKFSGEPAGYAFVHFQSDDEAIDCMHKLNGKPIPGTFPVVRFRLNTASRESKAAAQSEREFSVWVGDLSADVDDYSLYRVFSSKYNSIKTAKVIIDSAGLTKGYGFVRFGSEEEQKNALYAMNGYVGLGSKPLKICTAVPRPKTGPANQTYPGGQEYNQYYDPSQYWQNYNHPWSGYSGGEAVAGGAGEAGATAAAATTAGAAGGAGSLQQVSLVSHARPLDTDALNTEFVRPERCVWDALEESQWLASRG